MFSEIVNANTAIAWYEQILDGAKDYPKWVRERSELGLKFKDRTFANLDSKIDQKALKICKFYAENFTKFRHKDKNSLILTGDVGIGKTHLAAAIANDLIDNHNVPVCFGSIVELLDKTRSEMAFHRDMTT